jgi:hypothetical protein
LDLGSKYKKNEPHKYKRLNLRVEQNQTYAQNIIPLLIPKSRDSLDKLVVSELVKKFPTISGTTNYAYPQNVVVPLTLLSIVSLGKQHFLFWFLFPQTEGPGCLYILIFYFVVCSFEILLDLAYMTF